MQIPRRTLTQSGRDKPLLSPLSWLHLSSSLQIERLLICNIRNELEIWKHWMRELYPINISYGANAGLACVWITNNLAKGSCLWTGFRWRGNLIISYYGILWFEKLDQTGCSAFSKCLPGELYQLAYSFSVKSLPITTISSFVLSFGRIILINVMENRDN